MIYIQKIVKYVTVYSLYSIDTSISTQALDQWQLPETKHKIRLNKGYSRSKEMNSMTKEYCIEQDRYGVITQNVSRVTEELYGE